MIGKTKTYEEENKKMEETLAMLVSGYSGQSLSPSNFPANDNNQIAAIVNHLAQSYAFYMKENNLTDNKLYEFIGFNKFIHPNIILIAYLGMDLSKIYVNQQDFLFYNLAMKFQQKIIKVLTPILKEIEFENDAIKKNYLKGVIFSFHELFQEGIQIIKLKNTINSPNSDLENEKYIRCNESEGDNVFTEYKGRKFSWEELIYGLSDLNRHKHEVSQAMKDYKKVMEITVPEQQAKSLSNWQRKNRALYRMEAYFQKDFMNIPMQDIDVEGLALSIDILNSTSIDYMLEWFIHRFEKETSIKLTKLSS